MRNLLDQMQPGRKLHWLPVTDMLDGSELRIPVHIVKGKEDGPVLTLISTLHGAEWHSVLVVMEAVRRMDPAQLRGSVLALPIANPSAFGHLTRDTPGASDVADLNRVFPGGDGWLNLQIAQVITEEVLNHTDFIIDYHCGPWGATMENVGFAYDLSDPDVVKKSRDMAMAYGVYSIREMLALTAFPGPRSIKGYAGEKLKTPGIGICVGGSGFDQVVEERWLDMNVGGTLSVARHLGMYDAAEDRTLPEYLFSRGRGHVVNPQKAGMLYPEKTTDDLHKTVKAGTVLGRVVSPYTFETVEELVMPGDGVLFGVPRQYPVRPGEWAYFAADLKSEHTRIVRPGEEG